MKVYLNGKLVDRDKAVVSVFDHGLLYGDGVFEGIRTYGGLVFKLREHVTRLFESAKTICLEIPMTPRQVIDAVCQTLRANRLRDAYVRVVVTRGEGDLGLDPRKCRRPSFFIITDRIALYPNKLYRDGLSIITVPTPRNLPEALNPQIKSLNYLNNILAKIEANNAGVSEALMLSAHGYVAECTGDNIFMVKRGRLLTPPCYVGTLRGITRQTIIEIAKSVRVECSQEILTRHDLFNADEVFLTGTAAEVIPVVKIDSRTIGDGRPGKWTRRLMAEFHKCTRRDGVRI